MTTVPRVDVSKLASFRVEPQVLDTFPIGTFFIASYHGDNQRPATAMRLVRPNNSGKYLAINQSPTGLLLYYFWRSLNRDGGTSEAVKKLGQAASGHTWRWIVQPGEPGYDKLDAFKVACDHRRGHSVSDKLLRQALGLT